MNAPWTTPCAHQYPDGRTCGQPHHARIGSDGLRTYRHADGHAHTPAPGALARATATTPDDFEILFGNWAFCRRCGSSTSATEAGMAGHRQLHAEIDELRAHVDRLRADASRSTDKGGDAA